MSWRRLRTLLVREARATLRDPFTVTILIVVPLSFSDTRFMTFPPPGYSLRWYHAFFSNPAWIDAARTTLIASTCAALIATPLGVAAAYAIQNSTHRSMRYLRTVLMLPLMVPAPLPACARSWTIAAKKSARRFATLSF